MVTPSSRFDRTISVRFSLAALLLAVSFVALTCGLARQLGVLGLIASFDLIVAFLGFSSVLKITQLCGVRIRQLNFLEFLVLVTICVVLHGLQLPAVISGPHRRRGPTPVNPQARPTAPEDGTNTLPQRSHAELRRF